MTDIKVGQVWGDGDYKRVITCVIISERSFDAITNCGVCLKFDSEQEYNTFITLHKLLATYPTWQEAVASKEFKGE